MKAMGNHTVAYLEIGQGVEHIKRVWGTEVQAGSRGKAPSCGGSGAKPQKLNDFWNLN